MYQLNQVSLSERKDLLWSLYTDLERSSEFSSSVIFKFESHFSHLPCVWALTGSPGFLISECTNLLTARVQESQRCPQSTWKHLGPGFRHLSDGCHKLSAQTLQHWHGLSCNGPCIFSGKWLTVVHYRAHFYYILVLISSLMIKLDHVWANLSFILNIHCRFDYLSHPLS